MINLNECKKGNILIEKSGIKFKYLYKGNIGHIIKNIYNSRYIVNDGGYFEDIGFCEFEYIFSVYKKITVYALLDNFNETFDTKEELKIKHPDIDDFSIVKITYRKLLQQKE